MKTKKKIKKSLIVVSSKIKFLFWKIKNVNESYSKYYVENIERRLEKGEKHPTLGKEKKNKDYYDKTAKAHLEFLINNGLKRNSKVIDYGCGGLRLGRLLIEYLDKGCYIGMDVTDKFYMIGLNEINKDLVNAKKPKLFVITEKTIDEARRYGTDYIISTATLYHVPPRELNTFIGNIIKLIGEKTIAFIDFYCIKKTKKTNIMTWSYSDNFLIKKIRSLGASCEFMYINDNELVFNKDYKIIKLLY